MVAHRIILFMPVLDPDNQVLLHYWPFELHIQAETLDAQGTGELAFADLYFTQFYHFLDSHMLTRCLDRVRA